MAGVGARAVAERVQGALGGESRVPWGVAQDIVVRACFVRSAEESSSSSSAVSELRALFSSFRGGTVD